jgi:predicted transglutaminase-like cysteine proteinase
MPRLESLPLLGGQAGTDQTVEHMAKIAMGEFGAGSPRIRALALKIVREAGVPEKDTDGEIVAVHRWVKRTLRYVRDPVGYELLTYPETLAFDVHDGDCDDHAVLEAALLGALGIASRFVTVGMSRQGMSHVYLEAYRHRVGKWLPLDPIMKDQPAGWAVPRPVIIKRYPLSSADGFRKSALGAIYDALFAGLGAFAIRKLFGA